MLKDCQQKERLKLKHCNVCNILPSELLSVHEKAKRVTCSTHRSTEDKTLFYILYSRPRGGVLFSCPSYLVMSLCTYFFYFVLVDTTSPNNCCHIHLLQQKKVPSVPFHSGAETCAQKKSPLFSTIKICFITVINNYIIK